MFMPIVIPFYHWLFRLYQIVNLSIAATGILASRNRSIRSRCTVAVVTNFCARWRSATLDWSTRYAAIRYFFFERRADRMWRGRWLRRSAMDLFDERSCSLARSITLRLFNFLFSPLP